MDKKKAIAIAKKYFEQYPDEAELHVTNDEQVFIEKHHADNHARSFKEKEEQKVHTVSVDETKKAEKPAAPAAPAQ